MKVSLSWLLRYVDVELEPEELADALTMVGIEVGGIEHSSQGSEPPDVILDIDLTPNRPDCLSHIGVAREVSAITGAPLTLPDILSAEAPPAVDTFTSIDIEDPDACPRYVGRIIRDVAIGPSPPWLQQALTAVGLRPINNVVDVTNFVLMEWGQPLHAFDYDTLAEGRIIVRRARPGETIETIDEEEPALEPTMLVIADAARPVAEDELRFMREMCEDQDPNTILFVTREMVEAGISESFQAIKPKEATLDMVAIHGELDDI